jgi:hypothetical protein
MTMSLFDKIFGRQEKKQTFGQSNERKTIPTIDEFPKLNPSDRMGVIIAVGDSGKSDYFPFLKYAILKDADQNVKFAALKRIHLFKANQEVIPMLTEMKNNGSGQIYEPYFSMALSRLGIITMKEFEDIIKNTK